MNVVYQCYQGGKMVVAFYTALPAGADVKKFCQDETERIARTDIPHTRSFFDYDKKADVAVNFARYDWVLVKEH